MAAGNELSSAPMHITITVTMDKPSFHPGSVVSATVILQTKDHVSLVSSQSLRTPYAQRPPLAFSVSAASSPHTFASPPDVAQIEYIVAELSGRWNSDRAWIVPDAHPQVSSSIHLDNHANAPISSVEPRTPRSPSKDPTFGPYPWSASLADANAVGGGGRSGHSGIIFRSQPLVVCEDEKIPACSQLNFSIRAVLPDSLPPTLRGSSMRYVYSLVVAVKFPDDPLPRHIRIPFRVLPITTPFLEYETGVSRLITVPTPRDVGPRPNRFLQSGEARALSMTSVLLKSAPPDDIEIALALSMNGRLTDYKADIEHSSLAEDAGDPLVIYPYTQTPYLDNFASFSSLISDESGRLRNTDRLRVYSVTCGSDHVARLFVAQQVHYLGDSVSILFQFQEDNPCYRIEAWLEAQEVVNAKFAFGHDSTASATTTAMAIVAAGAGDPPHETMPYVPEAGTDGVEDIDSAMQDGVIFRKIYGEYGEMVIGARNTEIKFSIPHDTPASFTTGVITVRWLVQFVFVVPEAKLQKSNNENAASYSIESRDDIVPLLDEKKRSGTHGIIEANDGWRGGPWIGEDPEHWTHLPDKDTDVLRWTLPIVVCGQPGSQWGTRNRGEINHTYRP